MSTSSKTNGRVGFGAHIFSSFFKFFYNKPVKFFHGHGTVTVYECNCMCKHKMHQKPFGDGAPLRPTEVPGPLAGFWGWGNRGVKIVVEREYERKGF